jgi:hypothetical protein
MEANVFVDVQLIWDGSARWLWQLRGDHCIYGAGVCMSQTDAQAAGEAALLMREEREQARKAGARGPEWQTDTLDLDELERAEREQRELRGDDRRHDQEEDTRDSGTLIV